jgi:integrase
LARRAANNPRQIRSKTCGCPPCLAKYPGDRPPRKNCAGPWQARYRDPDGTQRAKNLPTRRDAEAFLDSVRTSVRVGTYLDPRRGQTTVAQWYDVWIQAQGGRPSTRARNNWAWTSHVEPKWGAWPLVAIGYMDVETWVRKELAAKVGHASQKKAVDLLRRMLTAAVRDQRIPHNPAEGIRLDPPPARHPDELRPPTAEQCEAIRAQLPPEYRSVMTIAEETGLRWGEYTALRVCNVDPEACTVKVREVLIEVNSRLYRQAAPKSAAGFRTVPLTPTAYDALEALAERWDPKDTMTPIGDGTDLHEEELLLRGGRGSALRRNNFRRLWIPAIQAAGVARERVDERSGRSYWWPRVHDLRHAWASRLHDAGVPEKVVQYVMGHERGGKVTWLYQHAAEDAVEQVREALSSGRHLRSVS